MSGHNNGTNMYFFTKKDKVPADRWKDITYGKIVCNVHPQKDKVNWTRLTMRGGRINIETAWVTSTANLLTIKLIFNSILSTPGAKF